jgi:hypothetical protein
MAASKDTTPALVPQSPLMSVVEFDGQQYYTSQYFHRQYVQNSVVGKGKYRQHKNFLVALRAIPAYQLYLDGRDIVELLYAKGGEITGLDLQPVNNSNNLEPLFRATGYNPLTLINATAQAALSHHLDDELSQQVSVAINTQAARQAGPSLLTLARQDIEECKEIARLFGAPQHIALQEAVKYVEKMHGLDFRPYLLASPVQDAIPDDEVMLEPTQIAERLGYPSAVALNKALEAIQWQVKHNGIWEPTDLGKPHHMRHAWINKGKSGYNIKWRLSAVRQALAEEDTL